MRFLALCAAVAVSFALSLSVVAQVFSGGGVRVGPPAGGSWQPLNNQPPVSIGIILLLTDGTIIGQDVEGSDWWKLTPDSTGRYVSGTWSQIASLPYTTITTGANSATQTVGSTANMRVNQDVYFPASGKSRTISSITNSTVVVFTESINTTAGTVVDTYGPLYFASAVLADGRVVVIGGEYNLSSGGVWTNLGAIYDPVANVWNNLNAPSGWGSVGDAQCCVFPDGRFLLANILNGDAAVLNPTTLTWSAFGSGKTDRFDEEGWNLLPEGTILTCDAINAPQTEKLILSTGQWMVSGSTPQSLEDSGSEELGPMVLRPNGTVFAMGATGHNAIYTQGGLPTDTGSWVAAPDFPMSNGQQLDIADGPACLLPNGDVICQTSPGVYNSPSTFYEFDGTNLTALPGVPNSSGDPSYVGNMIMLPTGQVLYTDLSQDVEIFTPNTGAQEAWRPRITSCPTTLAPGMSFILQGTQLNGLSQCSAYGDDSTNATNYPLVRITNTSTGHVQYARTHDHSTMAVATGSAVVSTHVDLPNNLELGSATLTVVTNGIASPPQSIYVTSEIVKGTVTLQNYSASSYGVPVSVQIRNVGSTTPLDSQTVTLDANGNFQMATTVAPGSYDITAKGSHWLRAKLTNQTLTSTGLTGLAFSLINGDINGDNTISLADFGLLKLAYGSVPSSSNWNPNADLDGNGSVGLSDFGILKLHYGQSGAP